ncbi:MAG: hypothetical protein V4664_01590 [Patescibacteria group bacterium]
MKSKLLVTALAAIVSVSTVGVVEAKNITAEIQVGAQANIGRGNVQATTTASSTVHGNATSTAAKNNRATTTTQGNATSTVAKNKNASSTAESHRSVVSTFVHSLLSVADREGGIGAQVRVIAQSQNDSATTTATAIAKVEGRGSVRTFLLGSDYKNLAVIRKEIATTTANIARLEALLDQTTNETDRAELNVQIQALEAEQAKVSAYVTAHQDVFSLFGWFNRLFVK